MKFTELKLHHKLMKGIEDAGFEELMPVQVETFKHTMKGKDVSVQSQTGTGKTAAFLITIFHHFLDEDLKKNRKALILAPTRELAIQIEKEARLLGRHLKFSICSIYGGVGYAQQEKSLDRGVDIIVGTPGRLLDFSYKKRLDFSDIGFLIIDEADRMFDMGFFPDIKRILKSAPTKEKRHSMLFSATLDARTRSIGREFMNRPQKVEIEPEQITVDKIKQRLYHVGQDEKLNLMLGILKREAPRNALIFTNTKVAAMQVAKHLEYNGFNCLHISGDLPQNKRSRVLNQFKNGTLPFLVATDVAARGLHIDDLEMIFNYDLPGDPENYVHRIGRTARAGKSGIAVSLACEDYIYYLDAIETYMGIKIPVSYAEDGLFEASKSEGMVFGRKKKPDSRRDGRDRKRRERPASSGKGKGPRFRKRTDSEMRTDSKDTEKPERRDEKKPPQDKKKYDKKKYDKKTSDKKPADKKTYEKKTYDKKKYDKKKPEDKRPEDKKYEDKKYDKKKNGNKDKRYDSKTAGQKKSYKKDSYKSNGKPRGGKKTDQPEDRIEYYKKKYGDDFKLPEDKKKEQELRDFKFPKKSIFKRVTDWLTKGTD